MRSALLLPLFLASSLQYDGQIYTFNASNVFEKNGIVVSVESKLLNDIASNLLPDMFNYLDKGDFKLNFTTYASIFD